MSSRRHFLSLVCSAVIACTSIAARAETPPETPPPVTPATLPAAPNGASCSDDSAARERKRDAALAELGQRLSAEPKPDGDYQVLNRSGHNYGSRSSDR
jgi:hypothetical protein